ncbi:MAG TPA: hypothetical protein VF679_07775, partial [Pedobacter sp.]
TGFLALLISFKLRRFRFLAIAYILIFLFLLQMNGKPYYIFGAYPMLFAAGGFAFEKILKRNYVMLRITAILLFVVPNMLLLPLVLPILPLNRTVSFFERAQSSMPFLKFLTVWEDLEQHPLTQDYSDMLGWEEMAQIVGKTYNALTPEQKKQTQIFADNYGEAGALHNFRKKYQYPDVVSLNSSFALWAPDNLNARYIIYVDDDDNVEARLKSLLESYHITGRVATPLAREKGTTVYLLYNPSPKLNEIYKAELAKKRLE